MIAQSRGAGSRERARHRSWVLTRFGAAWAVALVAGTCSMRADATNGLSRSVPAAAGGATTPSRWQFSILPKSFQTTPTLDMTFYTSVTPYGRLVRPASPENPVYYALDDAGYRQMGWPIGEKTPPANILDGTFKQALATNGFIPADSNHPPGLLIVSVWGSHSNPPPDDPMFKVQLQLCIRERARLIGGSNLTRYMAGKDFLLRSNISEDEMSSRLDDLTYQAANDIYFVVLSAYDYRSFREGKRQLVWRTTITESSVGLNMTETLRPLVASAAPYLGRETPEPLVEAKRINREGRVEIGTPVVVPGPIAK